MGTASFTRRAPLRHAESLEPRRMLDAGMQDFEFGAEPGAGMLSGFVDQARLGLGKIHATAMQPDGKLLLHANGAIARMTPTGQLDPTFAVDGRLAVAASGSSRIVTLPDGRFYLAGVEFATRSLIVSRFLPDGAADPSYGVGGVALLPSLPLTMTGQVNAVGARPDGRLFGVASETHLFRLTAQGAFDAGFNSAGVVDLPADGVAVRGFKSLLPLPDGSVLASFVQNVNNYGRPAVLKFFADGTRDGSFGSAGTAFVQEGYASSNGRMQLRARSDGKFYLITGGKRDTLVLCYNADGTRDDTFANHGLFREDVAAFDEFGMDGVVDSDDSLTIASFAWVEQSSPTNMTDVVLTHIRADGTRDMGFGETDGQTVFDAHRIEDCVSLERQADGQVILVSTDGGTSTSFDATGTNISRYLAPSSSAPIALAFTDDRGEARARIVTGDADDVISLEPGDADQVVCSINGVPVLTFDALSTLFIHTGAGDDLIHIGTAGAQATQRFNTGSSTADKIELSLAAGPVTLRSGGFRIDSDLGIVYGDWMNVESLDLLGTSAADRLRIESLPPAMPVRAMLGDGDDLLQLMARLDPEAAAATADVQVDLGPGAADTIHATLRYAGVLNLDGNGIDVEGVGPVGVRGFESVSLYGSVGNDVFNLEPLPDVPITVEGGGSAKPDSGDELRVSSTLGVGATLVPASSTSGQVQSNAPFGTISYVDIGSTRINPDTRGPRVRSVIIETATRFAAVVSFSEPIVSAVDAARVKVINLQSGSVHTLPAEAFVVAKDGMSLAVRLDATMPRGLYRIQLESGAVSNAFNETNALPAATQFRHQPGDVNGDLTVDFFDLLVLVANYGMTGRSHDQGDADYDGMVGFSDLLLIAQTLGQSMAGPLAIGRWRGKGVDAGWGEPQPRVWETASTRPEEPSRVWRTR